MSGQFDFRKNAAYIVKLNSPPKYLVGDLVLGVMSTLVAIVYYRTSISNTMIFWRRSFLLVLSGSRGWGLPG